MKRVLLASLAGGLVLAAALASQAGDEAPAAVAVAAAAAPQKYLLMVGVSEYADKDIIPRKHAEDDARALYKVLTAPEYGAVPAANARLLLGKPGDEGKAATRAAFLDGLKWLAATAKAGDEVTIGFFGQGGPLGEAGNRHCYFLSDSTFKGRDKTAVAAEDVQEALKGLKAKHLFAMLDLSFTGIKPEAIGKAVAEPNLGRSPFKEFLGEDGSPEQQPLPGRIALLATRGLTTSLDLEKHGAFATVLLDALKGAADGLDNIVDGKADGLVTVDEVARYLSKNLLPLVRKHGRTEKQKEQDYDILYSKDVYFTVSHNPAENKKRVKSLELLAELVKDKKLTQKLGDEARPLLDRMPRLKRKRQLRQAYLDFISDPTKLADLKEKRTKILASMKLDPAEAAYFADKVLDVIGIMQQDYIKPQPPATMVGHAVRALYQAADEKLPARIEKDLGKADMARSDLIALLTDARKRLGQREDLENNKDLTVTLHGMLSKLDPHTNYFDPETKKKLDDDIGGNFRGIGVQIRKDLATDQLLVVTPIKGSPAYKAKLWAGDLITRVKRTVDSKGNPLVNEKDKDLPTKGMPLNKVVKIIMGQPDTDVVLTIKREGEPAERDVKITRGTIEVESVLGARRKADDDWDFVIDHKHQIGYIRLTSFARKSYRDLERVMKMLVEKEKIKGFVLDLRFNPGGLLDAAVNISDLFIDDGVIVSIRKRGLKDRETRFRGRHDGSLLNFPMVCLVNGYSASGSEIVSAALQDHERARIVGERSYGKGSVQNLLDFEIKNPKTKEMEKAEIKLTTATFWRPNEKNLNKSSTSGKDTDEWGVTPDTVIKLSLKERRDLAEHQHKLETIERPDRRGKEPKSDFKDKQLDFALEYLRGMIKLAAKVPPVSRTGG